MAKRKRRRSSGPTRVEQARLRQQAASGGTPRTLAEAAAVRSAAPRSRPPWPVHGAWAGAAVALMAGWYAFGPADAASVSGFARWAALVATAAGAAWAGRWAWAQRSRCGPRARRATPAAAAVLVLLFAVGSATQVTVDGQVQFAGGDTAAAVRLIDRVEADLQEIAAYDELLRYETSIARVEIDRYQPAAQRLQQLAAEYASMPVEDLPSERFVPVLRQVATAAEFGALAIDGKRDLTLQHDARLEANVLSWHETYTGAVLTAGPLLADVAGLYGYPLVDPESDPVE